MGRIRAAPDLWADAGLSSPAHPPGRRGLQGAAPAAARHCMPVQTHHPRALGKAQHESAVPAGMVDHAPVPWLRRWRASRCLQALPRALTAVWHMGLALSMPYVILYVPTLSRRSAMLAGLLSAKVFA